MNKTQGEARAEVTFRFAKEEDMGALLGLIRELAAYEHLSHEVTADEGTLRSSLFGSPKVAEAILAEANGMAVGYAIFFHNFSTFKGKAGLYLEDIFVKPAFRGRGIGKRLFCRVAAIARERGCVRMEWAALNWNEPAIRFYRRFGTEPLNEWTVFRVTEEWLEKMPCDF